MLTRPIDFFGLFASMLHQCCNYQQAILCVYAFRRGCHYDQAMFQRRRRDCEIKLFVAELCCEPTSTSCDSDRQRQHAFAVSTQCYVEPIGKRLRKSRIDRTLPFDSEFDFPDRYRADE